MQVDKLEDKLRDLLKGVIQRLCWENLKENFNFENIATFDIVADRKIFGVKYYFLLTYIKQFDSAQDVARQKEMFEKITNRMQSRLWGGCRKPQRIQGEIK